MAKVAAGITVSVDGYITGPDDRPGRGLGEGDAALGRRLRDHDRRAVLTRVGHLERAVHAARGELEHVDHVAGQAGVLGHLTDLVGSGVRGGGVVAARRQAHDQRQARRDQEDPGARVAPADTAVSVKVPSLSL